MERFSYYTANKLREIFSDSCYLTVEQYATLTERLEDLVDMYKYQGTRQEEAEEMEYELRVIFDFMLDTKMVTLQEHLELNKMLDEMAEQAMKIRGRSSGRP